MEALESSKDKLEASINEIAKEAGKLSKVIDADAYDKHAYAKVLKILSRTVEGFPKIHTYDEVTFTLHNGISQPEAEEARAQ